MWKQMKLLSPAASGGSRHLSEAEPSCLFRKSTASSTRLGVSSDEQLGFERAGPVEVQRDRSRDACVCAARAGDGSALGCLRRLSENSACHCEINRQSFGEHVFTHFSGSYLSVLSLSQNLLYQH